jgi:hypothetical protein
MGADGGKKAAAARGSSSSMTLTSTPVCVAATLVAGVMCKYSTELEDTLMATYIGGLVCTHLAFTAAFAVLPTVFRDKPAVMAFEVISTVVVGHLAYVATPYVLQVSFPQLHPLGAPEDSAAASARLFDDVGLSKYINTIMAAYSLWELGLLVAVPSMRTWDGVLHHFAVALAVCAGMCCKPMHNGFYSPYFCGMQEISSVALAGVDIFKEFPSLQQKYPTGYLITRGVFALLFLLIRVVLWVGFALFYWRDYFTVVRLVRKSPITSSLLPVCTVVRRVLADVSFLVHGLEGARLWWRRQEEGGVARSQQGGH